MSRDFHSSRRLRAFLVGSILFASAREAAAETVAREALVHAALTKHPSATAAENRAQTAEARARAQGTLPDPELSVDLWQVPVSGTQAFKDAGMLMLGLRQDFPAPGSLSRKERAARAEANVERAGGNLALQSVARDVRHAFSDYVEATLRERAHASHRAVAERLVSAARARVAGGGSIRDVMRAELEVERGEAERAADEARMNAAKTRLNALLGRPLDAAIAPPEDNGAETIQVPLERLVQEARAHRPELSILRARVNSASAEAAVAKHTASVPSFSVAALYFAPVGPMPEHGIGASASVSLPWIWGAGNAEYSEKVRATAARGSEIDETERMLAVQVAEAFGATRSAEAKYVAISQRLLPVTQRRFEVTLAGYSSGQSSLLEVIEANQDTTMLELEIVTTRSELDHAVADLEWATGAPQPHTKLPETRQTSSESTTHGP